MKIQPVRTEGTPAPLKPKAQGASAKSESTPAATDRLEIQDKSSLMEAVQQEPGVRPEVLERAKSLVDDPNYPSSEILNRVAQRLLGR